MNYLEIIKNIFKVIPLLILSISVSFGQVKNGFNLEGTLIPFHKIIHGGPPRDGIPSIDNPKFLKAKTIVSNYELNDSLQRAMVVEIGNSKKLYPIHILNWHEIVNDKIDGKNISVTYCPLCGSGIVFSSEVKNRSLTFGVSGLLYQSDVLLYDRQTNSLWSQLMMRAISGEMIGQRLNVVSSRIVNIVSYVNKNPDALILSEDIGHKGLRDYSRNPYSGYEFQESIFFPVYKSDTRYHTKTWTLLIKFKEKSILIPITEFKGESGKEFISFSGKDIPIYFDKSRRLLYCLNYQKNCHSGFWFAMFAFYPDSEIYSLEN